MLESPVNATAPASPSPASAAPSSMEVKRRDFFHKIKAKMATWHPVAKEVIEELNTGFYDGFQKASESLKRGDVTPLPEDYLMLEKEVDRLCKSHELVMMMAALQMSGGKALSFQLTMAKCANDLGRELGSKKSLLGEQAISPGFASNPISENLIHAMAHDSEAYLGAAPSSPYSSAPSSPLSAPPTPASTSSTSSNPPGYTAPAVPRASAHSFKVWAQSQEELLRLKKNFSANLRATSLHRLFLNLEGELAQVNAWRKKVHGSRLRLDANRARLRHCSQSEVAELEAKISQLRKDLDYDLGLCTQMMKKAISSTQLLVAMSEYLHAELKYFKEGLEALEGFQKEMEELKEEMGVSSTYSPAPILGNPPAGTEEMVLNPGYE